MKTIKRCRITVCVSLAVISMASLIGCGQPEPVKATPQPVTPNTQTNTTGTSGNQAGTSTGNSGGIDQTEGIPTKR